MLDEVTDKLGIKMKFIDDKGNVIEDTKDLMALHNLSADKLQKIKDI